MKEQAATRLIMHVDMDAFFAAIEQRDDPSLCGKPVIVGAPPGRRGVVSTCSYEAREFGVHSAMPISKAVSKCPEGIFVKPDFKRYSLASRQVMEALESISPVVEPVSVDEAYVDISGLERLWGDAASIGKKAKQAIFRATGLASSVGIGPNRLLAKIASDLEKPDGLVIVPADGVLDFLAPLDVGRLRGVGRVLVSKLHGCAIKRIADLREMGEEELAERFGESWGRMLYRQARGIGSDIVGHKRNRKSISKETTFNEDIEDIDRLHDTLLWQSTEVGRTARKIGVRGSSVVLKIRLEGFETHTRRQSLSIATDDDNTIYTTAKQLLEESGYKGRPVRLIGLGITCWRNDRQLELFGRDDPRQRRLLKAKDEITARFGSGMLGLRRSGSKKDGK